MTFLHSNCTQHCRNPQANFEIHDTVRQFTFFPLDISRLAWLHIQLDAVSHLQVFEFLCGGLQQSQISAFLKTSNQLSTTECIKIGLPVKNVNFFGMTGLP